MSELRNILGEIKNKQVFQINDINLKIPPSNITIQQEDLVYQAKALRTSTTTKTPSGHGHCSAQVLAVVKYSQILDLHRLAVQVRNSPFVFIENRLLRETIVPDWPLTQSMAFTVTGMSLAPMPGASDTFVTQIDLQWFNYSPFIHNFFYRRDWVTEWLENEDPKKESSRMRKTIGWDIDPVTYERRPRPVVVTEDTGGSHREYDVIKREYSSKKIRTLSEMELLHPGEFFDLLPMPDRMEAAMPVTDPRNSMIFVRYSNYLQRDALLMNFGIDVEADLEAAGIAGFFFAMSVEPGVGEIVYPLHGVPYDSIAHQAWQRLYSSWTRQVNQHNGGVEMAFCIYKELRMPEKWSAVVHSAYGNSASKHQAALGLAGKEDWFLKLKDVSKNKFQQQGGDQVVGKQPGRIRIRPGISFTNGATHVPVGPSSGTPSVQHALASITSEVKWRTAAKVGTLYGTKSSTGRPHYGTDFGGQVGDPVYAVRSGIVKVRRETPHILKYADMRASGDRKFKVFDLNNDAHLDILVDIMYQHSNPPAMSDRDQERLYAKQHVDNFLGSDFAYTCSPARASHGVYVWREFSGGGIIVEVHHEDGSISAYMHLSRVLATHGERITDEQVRAGYVLAEMGATGPYSDNFLTNQFDSGKTEISGRAFYDSVNLSGDPTDASAYQLGSHLHFEYWEPVELASERNPKYGYTDGVPLVQRTSYRTQYVPIQFRVTLERASPDSPSLAGSVQMPGSEKSPLSDNADLTEAEVLTIGDQIDGLLQDGWQYYVDDSHIRNVWYKVIPLDVSRGNPDIQSIHNYLKFRSDTIVLTNMGGGVRHVVANIPVLGQEYPTQQHLGSVEPYYTFEFHSLDDSLNLDGLSANAQLLMGMRSVLQHNARKFRPVVDGWCLANNTFITRFFGSYREGDVRTLETQTPEGTEVEAWSLRRRLICTRAVSNTVEGSPGLSTHVLEMSETNPYTVQGLTASAPPLADIEERFEDILNALYRLEYDQKYQDLVEQLLLAEIAGANLTNYDDPSFGQAQIYSPNRGQGLPGNIGFARGAAGGDFVADDKDDSNHLYVRDPSGAYQTQFEHAGESATRVSVDQFGVISSDPVGEYIILDAGLVNDWERTGQIPSSTTSQAIKPGFEDIRGRTYNTAITITDGYITYDLSSLVSGSVEDQLAAEVPWSTVVDYKNLIQSVLDAAEASIFEHESEFVSGRQEGRGITPSQYADGVYNLPSEPQAWRQLTYVLKRFAQVYPPYLQDSGNNGLNYLMHGDDNADLNWPEFSTDLPTRKLHELDSAFANTYGTNITGALLGAGAAVGSVVPGLGWIVRLGLATGSAGANEVDSVRNPITRKINIGLYLPVDALEDILTLGSGGVFDGTYEQILQDFVHERFRVAGVQTSALRLNSPALTFSDPVIGEFATTWVKPFFGVLDSEENALASYSSRLFDAVNSSGMVGLGWADGVPSLMLPATEGEVERIGQYKHIDLKTPIKPWVWKVDQAEEEHKLDYFKDLLARIATMAAQDPGVMRALGMEYQARTIASPRLKGTPAYPDIVLPYHPYYGTLERVSPDFYMWNMYQDGRLFDKSIQEDIERTLNHVVANSYQGMRKLQSETGLVTPGEGNVDLENHPDSFVGFQPEGHDGGDQPSQAFGPSSTAFYETDDDQTNIENFWSGQSGLAEAKAGNGEEDSTIVVSSVTVGNLSSKRSKGVRMARGENYFGGGAGVQYASRVDEDKYTRLKEIWDGFENQSMFGHRAGFLGQQEGLDTDRLDNTNLANPSHYKHTYTLPDLQQMAKQAGKDLRGQKMMMRRAYPTFKLYFIEEDEFETRLLNFDDFHSYNGVVSFTVVQDRKEAADHAVITVQNISGTLDGTKRNVVTDLDYFADDTTLGRQRSGDDPSVAGSSADQPFGAIVLRPGMNVQLRAGYSNNPEELEVLISGRVVDVTWNKQSDQAELLVQSFGVELVQDIKGTALNQADGEPFYTTHELLGTMMLEPELMHFGRWEFGQRAQYGENNDHTLDFHDYSSDSFLSKFSWSTWAIGTMLDHPILTMFLAAAGTAAAARVGGGTWGVRHLLTWATRGNGAMARVLTKAGVTPALGAAFWRNALTKSAVARGATAGQVNGATKISFDIVEDVLANNANLAQILSSVKHAGGAALEKEASHAVRTAVTKASKVSGTAIDELAEALASGTASARTAILRGQWFLDPVLTNQPSIISAVGARPFVKGPWRALTHTPKWIAGAAGVGATLDLMQNFILDPILEGTIGRAEKFWKLTKSRVMLAPQDDNLFIPHPKDYMVIPDSSWLQTAKDVGDWLLHATASSLLFLEEEDTATLARYLHGDLMDKRITPDAAQYRPFNSTIWDIFHEMSLRHPGWVYGARPYGKDFRYTMFFGVPSQRYWAKPGNNEFVDRVNRLHDYLSSGNGISKLEYQRLYGDLYNGENLDDYDDRLLVQAIEYVYRQRTILSTTDALDFVETEVDANGNLTSVPPGGVRTEINPGSGQPQSVDGPGNPISINLDFGVTVHRPGPDDPDVRKKYEELQQHSYSAAALEEYLLGVETRFQPFRRYHSVHSDRDIVWNGIMGTENASYNAVDVTYYPEHSDTDVKNPIGTAFFKAHGRIPEYKLRVRPMQNYVNCRGYQMAMRYAMGQILHDVREAYRGELIILGNTRIRPWDICIMTDSYNDMAGPFEVERVVHTFSHETGFITELKPAGVVFANEISGYPMLTAMKMMTFAIRDLEDTYTGLQHGTLDLMRRVFKAQVEGKVEITAGWDLNIRQPAFDPFGRNFEQNIENITAEALRNYKSIYGENGERLVQGVENRDQPNLESLDALIDDVYGAVIAVGGLAALGVGAAAFKGTGVLLKAGTVSPLLKSDFLTQVTAGVAGGGLVLGGGAGVSASVLGQMSPVAMMWLLGSPLLMLNCLRGDSVIFVPLIKSGEPIVPSFSYRDPAAVWSDFKGELNRYIDDYVSGTRNVIDLWRLYGTSAWRELPDLNMLSPFASPFGDAVNGEPITTTEG